MGSSASKKAKVPKRREFASNDVDSQGFPKRDDDDFSGFPHPGSATKSVINRDVPKAKPPELYLKSLVEDQKYEIIDLKNENQQLRSKVEQLEKKLREFSLQLEVASASSHVKTQQDNKNNSDGDRSWPRIDDRVVAMWGSSKWQYFTATIRDFNQNTLKYTIEWDDGDPTGLVIDYYNLAVDKIPDADQIGVGSKVLFHQAKYKSTEVHGITRSGGLRWHQGKIDRIYEDPNGTKRYDGHHTKGDVDGKWVSYKGYSEIFTNYSIEDFRMPPNVFDILSSVQTDNPTAASSSDSSSIADIDVFVSYVKVNSPSAISANEIKSSDLPPSYEEAIVDQMCDPRDIVQNLKSMGVGVYTKENQEDSSLIEIVSALKKSKVFIACLSDEYASNDRCRMEFQYAKKTLKIPVIPIVVGAGSFQWQLTVVGLLIAGELYINFKNKEVQGQKMTELARAVKNFIPNLKVTGAQYAATGDALLPLHNDPQVTVTGGDIKSGTADYFFSYCWKNSKEAFDQKQLSDYVGNEWNDPRMIVRKLASSLDSLNYWLDVERLQSASESLGMFGQIATAMNECKFVIACISTEYANSDNSRMEFQFAMKSLKKPVIAVIVGDGDESWKDTAVGKLTEEGIPSISFQGLNNSAEFDSKLEEVLKKMKPYTKASKVTEETKRTFRAPVPGDHVVCLHQKWAYFMATVESFDEEKLEYTVNWDDGDPTGRVQSYKDLALDVVPTEQIGVGSIVMFSQGSYGGTDGNNTGGSRYHQGRITKVYTDDQGLTRFDGKHTKGEEDEKWITYAAYERTFENKTKEDLRVSPNAMDALMACKQAFQINDS